MLNIDTAVRKIELMKGGKRLKLRLMKSFALCEKD